MKVGGNCAADELRPSEIAEPQLVRRIIPGDSGAEESGHSADAEAHPERDNSVEHSTWESRIRDSDLRLIEKPWSKDQTQSPQVFRSTRHEEAEQGTPQFRGMESGGHARANIDEEQKAGPKPRPSQEAIRASHEGLQCEYSGPDRDRYGAG